MQSKCIQIFKIRKKHMCRKRHLFFLKNALQKQMQKKDAIKYNIIKIVNTSSTAAHRDKQTELTSVKMGSFSTRVRKKRFSEVFF